MSAFVLGFFVLVSVKAQVGQEWIPNGGGNDFRNINLNELVTTEYLRDSSYTFSVLEELDSSWTLRERSVYQYDMLGQEVLRNLDYFDFGKWHSKLQIRSAYMSGFLDKQEESIWSENQWNLSLLREYEYNYIGLLSEIKSSNQIDDIWVFDSKITYQYNSDYNLSVESNYDWSEYADEWVSVSRYIITYNNDDEVGKEVFQIWIDSTNVWQNKTSKVFNYDQSNNLISTLRRTWSANANDWVNTNVTSLKYNENGQFLGSEQEVFLPNANPTPVESEDANYDVDGNVDEVVKSQWDSESKSWDVYQKQIHYWSQYKKAKHKIGNADIDCFFANPYTIGYPVYCNGLKTNVTYTVTIYDLSGRFYYSDSFNGDSGFRIKEHIEPGFYILNISGGLDSHSEKVYIK